MKTKIVVWPMLVGLGLVLGACGSVGDGTEAGATPDPSSETEDEPTTTNAPVDPSMSGTSSATGAGSEGDLPAEESETGCNFFCPLDSLPPVYECDMFLQDCPDGEKCMPYAADGGNSWNATRCAPIEDNAGQAGDECSVEGTGTSGVDDCDLGSMCWDVDPETNIGTCAAMCTGDPSNPICEDPDTACVNVNDGAIVLCLPGCDPLLQDCADGQACYGIDNVFTCVPDASGETGIYGDACEFINVCDPGLFCANANAVPGCAGTVGCCSEFCDLEDAAGDAQCSGAAGGQACMPWTEDPQPGLEAIGACVIPT